MPYIIDGHNLIPKVPGLSLSAVDDEMQLVVQLQEFCRLQRKSAEVYFDNAPPGMSTSQRFGMVTAHFIRQGMSADTAIHLRLQRLGKNARNWTVVSSDLAVQSSARVAQANYLSSEGFTRLLIETSQSTRQSEAKGSETSLTPEELEEWLRIFNPREHGSQL
jgi:predicted RNA-binding protein with PIN domain